jgi:hypothetical protein
MFALNCLKNRLSVTFSSVMKQDALGTNQQNISAIENSETIAEVLGVSVEGIKNFSQPA